MRENKFRAWDTVDGCYIDNGIAITKKGDWCRSGILHNTPTYGKWENAEEGRFIIEWYLGNGVYEGDILHFTFGIPAISVYAEVKFQGSGFYVLTPNYNPKMMTVYDFVEMVPDFTIEGNINENKDLIKVNENTNNKPKNNSLCNKCITYEGVFNGLLFFVPQFYIGL